MSQFGDPFRPSRDGYFMEIRGPAWYEGKRGSQKKLCFVATDRALLADVLRRLAERPDCCYVKYSVHPRDGMYLGRCFLTDEHEVGVLWAEYKAHPACSAPFRMTTSRPRFVPTDDGCTRRGEPLRGHPRWAMPTLPGWIGARPVARHPARRGEPGGDRRIAREQLQQPSEVPGRRGALARPSPAAAPRGGARRSAIAVTIADRHRPGGPWGPGRVAASRRSTARPRSGGSRRRYGRRRRPDRAAGRPGPGPGGAAPQPGGRRGSDPRPGPSRPSPPSADGGHPG